MSDSDGAAAPRQRLPPPPADGCKATLFDVQDCPGVTSPHSASAVRDVTLRPAHRQLARRRARSRELSLVPDEVIPAVVKAQPTSPSSTDRRRGMEESLFFESKWTFWIDVWEKGGRDAAAHKGGGVTHSMQEIGSFRSIREFWQFFNNMPLSRIQPGCSLHLFKHGIRPTWEDPANRDGGRFRISRMQGGPGINGRVWQDVCLALVGEQFKNPDQVCGATFASRAMHNNHASIWIRAGNADDPAAVSIREQLHTLIGQGVSLAWVPHKESQSKGEPVLVDKISLRHRRARSTPMQVSDDFIEAELRARQRRKQAAVATVVAAVVAVTEGAQPPPPRPCRPEALSSDVLDPSPSSLTPSVPAPPPPTPAAPSTPRPDGAAPSTPRPDGAARPEIPTDAAACAALTDAERHALKGRQLRAAAEENYEEAIVIRDLLRVAQGMLASASCPPPGMLASASCPPPQLPAAPAPAMPAPAASPDSDPEERPRKLLNPVTGKALTAAQRRGVPGHRRRHTDTAKGDFIPTQPLPRPLPRRPPPDPYAQLPLADDEFRPHANCAPHDLMQCIDPYQPSVLSPHSDPACVVATPAHSMPGSRCSPAPAAVEVVGVPSPPPSPIQPLQPLPQTTALPMQQTALPVPQAAMPVPQSAMPVQQPTIPVQPTMPPAMPVQQPVQQPPAVQSSVPQSSSPSPPRSPVRRASVGYSLPLALPLSSVGPAQPPSAMPLSGSVQHDQVMVEPPTAAELSTDGLNTYGLADVKHPEAGSVVVLDCWGQRSHQRPTVQPGRPPLATWCQSVESSVGSVHGAATRPRQGTPTPTRTYQGRAMTAPTAPPFVHNRKLYPSGLSRRQRRAIMFDHPDKNSMCPPGAELGFDVENGPVSAQKYNELSKRMELSTRS
eukprot:TRINITY_DN639_c0_g1_i1.p1 TRINITY_DN639_c0_g1~~TRINITY_DN639_c0_g1_i1.p1  ORF type:complete len:894 (+),score=208.41 TRINITY_DN639_c0_g1_i1:49-2730(+)